MKSSVITGILAWEALDSRGNPTVGCEVRLSSGAAGAALAPAGASTGRHEARELRDGDSRYDGRGAASAVRNVAEVLSPAIKGLPAAGQPVIDDALRAADGTPDLSRLGANAIIAVSLAAQIAAAADAGLPLWRYALPPGSAVELPMPMVNILSGGAHAGRAVDIQDILVMPLGARDFRQAIEWVDRVRRETAKELRSRGLPTALVADEGGYGPVLPTNQAGLEIVTVAIDHAGLAPVQDVGIALDIAASQFFDPSTGRYLLAAEDRSITASEWAAELSEWADRYPIVSIEDPMAEDDWDGWAEISGIAGAAMQIVGDDLFTTNIARLDRGITLGVANSILVKPNQIGTVTDARNALDAAQAAGYGTILSARSGETEDSWLADLAVAWHAGQIKVGSLARSERTAKWNRLLRLQAELDDQASFAGRQSIPIFARCSARDVAR